MLRVDRDHLPSLDAARVSPIKDGGLDGDGSVGTVADGAAAVAINDSGFGLAVTNSRR